MSRLDKKNLYLERYADQRQLWPPDCDPDTRLFVVIPAFRETNLLQALQSLSNCNPPGAGTEILVVINEAIDAARETTIINQKIFQEVYNWVQKKEKSNNLHFRVSYVKDLPAKQAGVGMARKIGMDQAIRRINTAHIPAKEAILICFDADCACDQNYLQSIEKHFSEHPVTPGASIFYEHPLKGPEPPPLYQGIIRYESFLRYYVGGLRYAGYPHAFQTVGSSMAVRADAYQKQGGMNKRKAGEDFYFLQKIFPLGDYSEINDTCVYPSPRISDRVPFGTGKAMQVWTNSAQNYYPVYHHEVFISLKKFIEELNNFYGAPPDCIDEILNILPESIKAYLDENNFKDQLKVIKNDTSTYDSFRKRFFQWFTGLKVLKYVHFARDHYYGEEDVLASVSWLLKNFYSINYTENDPLQLLETIRKKDREYKCGISK